MNIEQLFTGANIFVLPFWTLMILLPNWGVTKKIIESYIPFVILAGLYIFLISGTLNEESAQALANPTLADIARFFAEERAAATGWVHFLVMDLFVGRWIYLQGQRIGVWTIHSLILCLFAGPLGLLSHIVTEWITQKFLTKNETEATPST